MKKIITNKALAVLEYKKELFRKKIGKCTQERDSKYNGRKYVMGEKAFIQKEDKKRWSEGKVFIHDSSKVWVMHNGTPCCINEMIFELYLLT